MSTFIPKRSKYHNITYSIFECISSGEDKYLIYEDINTFICVVADGVGSCMYARRGAEFATKAIVDIVISKNIDKSFNTLVVERWKYLIGDVDYNDYSTALVALIIKENKLYYYVVGDCFIYDGTNIISSEELFSSTSKLGDNIYRFESEEVRDFNILISTDGLSKYVSNINQLKVVANEIINVSSDAKNIIKMINEYSIDDVTIIVLEREGI